MGRVHFYLKGTLLPKEVGYFYHIYPAEMVHIWLKIKLWNAESIARLPGGLKAGPPY